MVHGLVTRRLRPTQIETLLHGVLSVVVFGIVWAGLAPPAPTKLLNTTGRSDA
jgi:hypothetical protein